MSSLTSRINSYFAILLVTLAGAGASLIIMHVANTADTLLTKGDRYDSREID
jgi:hypothetical protein